MRPIVLALVLCASPPVIRVSAPSLLAAGSLLAIGKAEKQRQTRVSKHWATAKLKPQLHFRNGVSKIPNRTKDDVHSENDITKHKPQHSAEHTISQMWLSFGTCFLFVLLRFCFPICCVIEFS